VHFVGSYYVRKKSLQIAHMVFWSVHSFIPSNFSPSYDRSLAFFKESSPLKAI